MAYTIGIDTGGTFTDAVDEMSAAEPAELAGGGTEFLLRHHCCPACGVLFEVEPVLTRPAGAP